MRMWSLLARSGICASPVAAAIARPLSTVERRERIRAGIDALRALLAARGLRYRVEIAAPPGEATLAVVVVDRTSGERCALRVELGGGR